MKIKVIQAVMVLMFSIVVMSCGNNRSYEGTYTGTLPCADCEGIKMEISLKGGKYTIKSEYQGVDEENKFEEKGSYTWDAGSRLVTLDGDASNRYLVENNTLVALDQDGNKVTGGLANMYILKKR